MSNFGVQNRSSGIERVARKVNQHKDGEKLRVFAPSSTHLIFQKRTGKKTLYQWFVNRFKEGPQVQKNLGSAIDPVFKDHQTWADPVVRADAIAIKRRARLRRDLRVAVEGKMFGKLAEKRRELRETGFRNELHDIFSPADPEEARRQTGDLDRFAQPASEWQTSTRENFAKMLGLESGDPCIESFQRYVADNLAAAGDTPLPHDAAHLFEFVRRWNMAKQAGRAPDQVFGWGEAVGRVVNVLAKEFMIGAAHEPSAVYLPAAMTSLALGKTGAELADALTSGSARKLDALAAKLGKEFAAQLARTPRSVQMAFIISKGEKFLGEVKQVLLADPAMQALREAGMTDEQQAALQQCLAKCYECAVSGLPDRIVDSRQVKDAVTEKLKTEISSFHMDGDFYEKPEYLTSGGYGSADRFRSADGKLVVLKTPIPTFDKSGEALFKEGSSEVRAHDIATSLDRANIIGIKGVLRMPDGGLAIAVEYADGGDLDKAIPKIHEAAGGILGNGGISGADLKKVTRTIAMDLVSGLEQLERAGLSHIDLKTPNVFLKGGTAKLADFGAAQEGRKVPMTEFPVDNMRWRDPVMAEKLRPFKEAYAALKAESLKVTAPAEKKKRELRDAELKKLKAVKDKVKEHELLTPEIQDLRDLINAENKRLKSEKDALEPGIFDGFQGDIWSIGVSLYQVFFNQDPPFIVGNNVETETSLEKYTSMRKDERLDFLKTGIDADAAADTPDMLELIARCLHPDPEQRIAPAEALRTYFNPDDPQNAEVGSERIRALIAEITTT